MCFDVVMGTADANVLKGDICNHKGTRQGKRVKEKKIKRLTLSEKYLINDMQFKFTSPQSQ